MKLNLLEISLLAVIVVCLGALTYEFTGHDPLTSEIVNVPTAVSLENKAVLSPQSTISAPSHATGLVSTISKTADRKTIHQLRLTPENTVLLVGQVTSQDAFLGQQILEKSKHSKVIYLLINSPGGSVLDGNLVVSAIQASPVPVVTIDFQLAASMAAIIFSYGKQRYMVDRSILMFHEAAGGIQGSFNQIHSRFKLFNGIVNKIDAEIAQRVGIKYEDFRSKLSNELWMDAEDAVSQNFADGYVNLDLTAFNLISTSPEEKARFRQLLNQPNWTEKVTHGYLVH